MKKWKLIKSAPKDGTRVLLYGKNQGDVKYINVGYFDDTIQIGPYPDWRWGLTFEPTHWMELPNPPK